jgi:DNA-binding GntR family transcriptional regulator
VTSRVLGGRMNDYDFSRISRENLSDRAYNEVRLALMRSRLKPGERLLLRPLSIRLGLSVTPVREALLRLVSEQALFLDERGTVTVPTLDYNSLLEIRDLRVGLEGKDAAAAATIATNDKIDELEELHNRMLASLAVQDYQGALEHNEQFHFHLCAMAQLPIVYQFVGTLWMRCGPILTHLYDKGIMQWDIHPHIVIISALRERRGKVVRKAISDDILRGGEELLAHVKAQANVR